MSAADSRQSLTVAVVIRKYRESYTYTQERLASVLGISPTCLADLEEGRLTKYPLADVKAVLKRFCYVCNLNSTRVLELCEADYHAKRTAEKQSGRSQARVVWLSPTRLLYGMVGLMLLVGVSYVGVRTYTFAKKPEVELSVHEAFQTISEERYTVRGSVNPAYELYLNGKRVKVSQEGKFELTFRLRDGHNLLEFRARKPNGQTTEKVRVLYHS